ncbi:MAG: hypothetical protein K2L00_04540 [Muribaculaceae bacterium]|nr:hypothetical protein [Muribaculaceae bacterium]
MTITQQASTYTFDVSPNSTRYIPAEGETVEFSILSLSGWDITTNDPEWIEISPTSGTGGGNEREIVSVKFKANDTGRQRPSSIHFNPRTEGYTSVIVDVVQSGYDLTYAGSVQSGSTSFAATGGVLTYSLDSRFNWEVSAPNWITATPSIGQRSEQRQTITLQVAPNTTNSLRDDIVTITPVSTVFPGDVILNPAALGIEPIKLSVNQYSFNVAFGMNPGGFDVVPLDGGSYEVTVNSRFDWRLTVPEWVTASRTEGTASATEQKITVTIGRNPNNGSRNGILTLTPLTTNFDGVNMNPSSFGIEPQIIAITQFGGREAAISVPWLVDGYTHTTATIEFNFYSPFYEIVEAGLEWGLANSTERQTLTVKPTNSTDGTVSFELTGLNAATNYVARGYVKDSQGNVKYGDWSYPFTTAGRYPGSGDNPTPSR